MKVDEVKSSIKKIEASLDFCEELLSSKPKNEFDFDNTVLKFGHAKRQVMINCMELDKLLK
jgi:hypothetical protein